MLASVAMDYVNLVAGVAEEEKHHPDIYITDYRNVRLVLSTHAIGGRLTLPDFVVAAKLDALPVQCSPKWLELQQAKHQPHQKKQDTEQTKE